MLSGQPTELRWQTGYFSIDALPTIAEHLEQMRHEDQVVRALIGSNDGATVRADLDSLIDALGLPRDNAKLGVVSYGNALYHPKTFHFRFRDGHQAAYVGSANFTRAGVSSLNIECGMLLDTRAGDSPAVLSAVALAVDAWFETRRQGITVVYGREDSARLASAGVISDARPATRRRSGDQQSKLQPGKPQLRELIAVPRLSRPAPITSTSAARATRSGRGEVLLVRVRPRRNGRQFQISKRVHESPFMERASSVVLADGSHRPIQYSRARGGNNTARFEAPLLASMTNPVARFRWTGRGSNRALRVDIFDADSNATGSSIYRTLEDGISSPALTNLTRLSSGQTILSKANRGQAQWYRLVRA